MDSIWPFETAEYRELVDDFQRLQEENEDLRAFGESACREVEKFVALLTKEAQRKGGRPPKADRKEESAERADRRRAERWHKDPLWARSEAAWAAIDKAKREGWW